MRILTTKRLFLPALSIVTGVIVLLVLFGISTYRNLDRQKAAALEKKLRKNEFTLEDFANQLRQMRKMGPIQQLLDMLPGNLWQAARGIDPKDAERQLRMTEAIIGSMTSQERRHPDVLNASRRRRIARGSGTDVQDVNRILKQFREAQRLMKTLQKTGGRRGLPPGLFG